jgi:hypothetical protein
MSWSKYNIDALLKEDGTFKPASYWWIAGARDCGHTAHLETEHGVVAFRPYKDREDKPRWRLDFYGPYQEHIANRDSENADFGDSYMDRIDLIRWAYKHLNGSLDTLYQPNDGIEVYANQAEREGYVLATIGDEVLLEYEMPGTTAKWANHPAVPWSALRVIKTIGKQPVGDYKSVSYNNVPKKWLKAIEAAGTTDWIGMGQKGSTRIPFPSQES